jgi:hypothetical protein
VDPKLRRGAILLVTAIVCLGIRGFAHTHAEAQTGVKITPAMRAAGLRFAPGVAAADEDWIRASLAQARPEAAALIDDVDGLVTISTFSAPGAAAIGLTQWRGQDYAVSFNVAYLDANRVQDRNVAVLHEFGHVIDNALVSPQLHDELVAAIPATGACFTPDTGDCADPHERLADTFAKWALRGAVSAVGAGYSIGTPASLEDWGAPLATLAVQIAAGQK